MPFLSEEIWQFISTRKASEALVIARYPEQKEVNDQSH